VRQVRTNIGTALLALVLAVVVWVNATYQSDRPQTDYFSQPIPVTVLNAPADYVVTNEPVSEIQVEIKAFTSTWSTLTVKDFVATADWSSLQPGMNEVPVSISCSSRTVTILDHQPQTIYVQAEPWSDGKQLDVSVELDDQDDLPLGYDVIDPHAEPAFVTIAGAISAVDSVAKVEARVSLKDQTSTFERSVALVALDAEGSPVESVQFSHQGASVSTAQVSVEIRKSQNYREVAVRARTSGQPAKSYFVSSVDVEPQTVTVFGIPEVIDTMGGLVDLQSEVDVSDATRMVADRIALDLPEGVQVLGGSEDEAFTVLVTVEIDAVTGYTTVELTLTSRALDDGLVARLSVPEVEVILTGPAATVEELQIGFLEAYVDLGGLGVGTHQIKPIVRFVDTAPEALQELEINDWSPKSIEVSIAEPTTPTPTLTPTYTPTIAPTLPLTVTATPTMTLIPEFTPTPAES